MDLATLTLWLGNDDDCDEDKITLGLEVEMDLSEDDRHDLRAHFRSVVVPTFIDWIDQHYGGGQDARRLDKAHTTLMRNRKRLSPDVSREEIDKLCVAVDALREKASEIREERHRRYEEQRKKTRANETG